MVFLFIASLFVFSGHAEEVSEWSFPPIIVRGSPIDQHLESSYAPTFSSEDESSFFIGDSIQKETPFSVTEQTTPGSLTQLRGLGRTVEETSVETLGVPLQYPQGGGADLSLFPSYLWKEQRFYLGPSLGAAESQGSAGTLALTPWTAERVQNHSNFRRRVDFGVSSAKQGHWAAGSAGPGYALLAGYSLGAAQGPSGSGSVRILKNENTSVDFHLLGTSLLVEAPGSVLFPTPEAFQHTTRVLPVIQTQTRFQDWTWTQSTFADWSWMKFEDPSSPLFNSQDRTFQAGTDGVLSNQNWKLGLGVHHVEYSGNVLQAVSEQRMSGSIQYAFHWNQWTLEPALGGRWLTRMGAKPHLGVGVRVEGENWEGMGRVQWSSQSPSLLNRYYQISGIFEGNPNLKPEEVLSVSFGGKVRGRGISYGSHLLGQWKQDVNLSEMQGGVMTVLNQGSATVLSWIQDLHYEPWSFLELSMMSAVSASRVFERQMAYPYLPFFLGALGIEGILDSERAWRVGARWRVASAVSVTSDQDVLPGYGVVDLEASWRLMEKSLLFQSFMVSFRVENLFDRSYQLVKDYPVLGRAISVSFRGEL